MFPNVGLAIWAGALERLAFAAADVSGAALTSNLRRLVGEFYPGLPAASSESLIRYAAQAIGASRLYRNAADDFVPFMYQLADPRRAIEYAIGAPALAQQGYTQQAIYQFTVTTLNRNLSTGEEVERTNRISIFSPQPLSRLEALQRANLEAAQWILFQSTTDRNNRMTLLSTEFNAVYLGYALDE